MPFPETWDKKVKVAVFPFRRNNTTVCHNCWRAFHKNDINCCTGLCRKCEKLNPTEIQIPKKQQCSTGREGSKCGKVVNYTNFGIYRQESEKCAKHEVAIQQRCLGCDKMDKNCWHNSCRNCMEKFTYLCEHNGYVFLNQNQHFRLCWCLNHKQQVLRRGINTEPPVTRINSE